MSRLLGWLAALPRHLWSGTFGRLLARPAAGPPGPVIREREEPRSVAGIALTASLVVLGVVIVAFLAYQLRLLLTLMFLAVLLSAGLYGVAVTLERWLPRVLAVLLTFIGLFAVIGLALFLIFPPLITQAVSLVEDAPAIIEQLRQGTIDFLAGFAGRDQAQELIDTITQGANEGLPEFGSLVSVPLTFAGILANTIITVFLSALVLIERDRIRRWALDFVTPEDRELAQHVGRTALLKLGAYVRGQLLVMFVIGIGSFTGMVVVGLLLTGEPLPFAVPLGALSFITAAIPLAGAFIAGGPIVLVALTVSPLAALVMAAWLVVLQQLEGSIITPIVQGRAVNLSAVAVLLGVVAGTSIAGIVGGIIAIPVVAVADVVIREVVFPLRQRRAERRRQAPAL